MIQKFLYCDITTGLPQFILYISGSLFYAVWFGIRKDFYDLAVENIPILQEYFNISYNYPDEQPVLEGGKVNVEHKQKHHGKKLKAPTGHIEKLDAPD